MSVELIEIEPGRFVVDKPRRPPARSHLSAPMIIRDEMPPTEQVDGRFYTSKRKFRDVGRALGLIEIGNEKIPPRIRQSARKETKQQRRDTLKTALEKYKSGHRVRRAKE